MRKAIVIVGLVGSVFALGLRAETNQVFKCQLKIVDAQGRPIVGAVVEQFRVEDVFTGTGAASSDGSRKTDITGTVSFTSTTSTYHALVATKPGLALNWVGWFPGWFPGQEDARLELILTSGKSVAGVIQDAAGKPLVDTLVWVKVAFQEVETGGSAFSLLPASLSRQRFSARTGADGEFHIDGLPAGAKLDLGITRSGMALDRAHESQSSFDPTRMEFEVGQSNIVLKTVKAGAIEGRVVKADGTTPEAGARVSVAETAVDADSTHSAVSGPDGVFQMAGLEAGEYQLQAQLGTNVPPDLICEPESVTVQSGTTNREAKLTLTPGGFLEITLQNAADEKPIVGAMVYAGQGFVGIMKPVRSSERGIARFRLPPGDYQTFAGKGQNSVQGGQTTVELDRTNQTTLSLNEPENTPKLTGTVVDAGGRPAPQVSVLLFPLHDRATKTDTQGRFELGPLPQRDFGTQNREEVLIARDADRNLAAAIDIDEDATNANLRLEPGLTLLGRVTGTEGQAITNARVTLTFWSENTGRSFGAPTKVDAAGKFEIKGWPRGRHYGVNADAAGYGQQNRNLAAADTATARVELEPFHLPLANLRLAGIVLDANDKPVAGAMLDIYGSQNQPRLKGRTDARGHFAFEHVCSGSLTIGASNPRGGGYGNASAESGDTNVTIRLAAQMRKILRGVVLGTDGKPAAKVALFFFPSSSGAPKNTDDAGQFLQTSYPNSFGGPVSKRVLIATDLVHNLAGAGDLEADATNATLQLAPAWTLAGQVTDTAGHPITNAQAQLMVVTDQMSSSLVQIVRVHAEGKFEFPGLPAGRRFRVSASAKGYGEDAQQTETGVGDNRRVELGAFELLVADQRIAGVVLDTDDKPVGGAWLHCSGAKQTSQTRQSDSKGHFLFTNVCAGSLRISATSPSGGSVNTPVDAGDTNITLHVSDHVVRRLAVPRTAALRGKPLPDLAVAGLTAADAPTNQPVLALLIDAEQRSCRRVLRSLGEQAAMLKQKGVVVAVLHSGDMAPDAFTAWKQEAATPFPVGQLKSDPDKTRATWGAGALPWFILTDKAHNVVAEGFGLEDLDEKVGELK